MKSLAHPIIFYRLVKYHLFSGLTVGNALSSAINNIKRTVR